MFKFFLKNKFFFLLALFFLFLRIPSLFEPYWYGDEGIYLVLGQAIRRGVTLYSRIHDNKPPTLYYLAALSQTVFGFRLLLMIIMAPTIYFFHRLSRQFLTPISSKIATFIFLVLTSIPLIEGNIANAEVFMLLPTIIGVLLLIKPNPSLKKIIISGFLLGLAFTIKIPVAIEFAFLCLWLFINDLDSVKKIVPKIKNILIFSVSFLIPIIIWSVFFYLKGAFKPFIFASLLQNFGYLSSWSTGSHTSSPGDSGLIIRFLILIAIWVFIFLLKIKKTISIKLSFLLFWFFATIFGALLSSRPYPHYLIQVLPPLVLLIMEFFNFKNIKNQLFSLVSIIFLIISIIKFNFYFFPVFSYYSNFYTYAIGQKSETDYKNYFGSHINDIYQISSLIKNNTTPKDRIFIWGDESYLYALSDRLPPSKYMVAYHIIDFNGYQSTMDKIKANLPKFIVYYQMRNRNFDELDQFIKNYYIISQITDKSIIYRLR